MSPKTVGAGWKNGKRGSPARGRLRKLAPTILAVLAVAVLASCGIRPTGVIPGLQAPSGPVENPSPSVYWVAAGQVVPVARDQGSLTGRDVVALLAQGPSGDEQQRGLSTEVPFDAAPATVDRVESGLDVTVSTDVSLLSRNAVRQIVCTLLAVQAVGTVHLRGGGHSLEGRRCG
ncbi:hypothetical protein AB0A63_05050 [Lentzea sp. NPDC042327]|uniref:GerMN domain-containing protein n=1 Tax=Lentzea sp. NPDC042327 TaxID=3154801 RepID=UPI00340A5BA5